jgi:hypothetical protein
MEISQRNSLFSYLKPKKAFSFFIYKDREWEGGIGPA